MPLAVVLAGTFMVILDFFIVNVALPSMQARLHASSGAIEWVVAGYAMACAVLLITAGRAGDRFGRRRAFCAGLALFTLASAACGLAPDATVLVIARVAQGAGGALLMPNVLAIINVTYEGAQRVRALSAYGMVMGVAAAGGQIIGGGLVAVDPAGLGWRSCFLINLPIGLAALLSAPRAVAESRDERATEIDLAGTALITAALLAVVLPLVQGRQYGWPAWTWVSLALSPALVASFVLQQRARARRGGAPLIDLSLFARRAFSAGLLAQVVFWAGQASFFLVLALYLQQGRGLSALKAGLVFTILAAAYLAASLGAPALAVRHGRRVLGLAALVLACGHLALFGAVSELGTGGSLLALVPGLALVGAGMGLAITPLVTIILGAAPVEQAGEASGILSTVQNVGNAIGVAVIGAVFFGAVHAGVASAFRDSVAVLAGLLLAVALISRLLPAPEARA